MQKKNDLRTIGVQKIANKNKTKKLLRNYVR